MLPDRPFCQSERRAAMCVVVTTALAYLLFAMVALLIHGMSPLWFVWLDDAYHPSAPPGSIGYDGQFVYAIALDGLDASDSLDNPPYRLQRILLPAVAGALAVRTGDAGSLDHPSDELPGDCVFGRIAVPMATVEGRLALVGTDLHLLRWHTDGLLTRSQ